VNEENKEPLLNKVKNIKLGTTTNIQDALEEVSSSSSSSSSTADGIDGRTASNFSPQWPILLYHYHHAQITLFLPLLSRL